MADSTSDLICTRSELSDLLSQISQLTIDQVTEVLGQATGLSSAVQSIIFHMKQEGRPLEQISQEVQVTLEVLKQVFSQNTPETEENKTSPASERLPILNGSKPDKLKEPELNLPQFIYSCKGYPNQLYRTHLLTGEQSCYELPHYEFLFGCRWSELPGGSLLITGGLYPTSNLDCLAAVREVVRMDTLREWAVSSQPPMYTARSSHAAVYYSQYVNALGGYSGIYLSECERYSCAESRWEVLPALPVAGCSMSTVVLGSSLYVLGGETACCKLDTVQKLSLDSLTWELMQF
jgi:hypothetical protein